MCNHLQLGHPVIRVLQGTDKQWLIDVMYAFNAGEAMLQ